MLKANEVFSGFSVDDLTKTKKFYTETLGLRIDEDSMGLHLVLPSGAAVYIYHKDDHQPAAYTVLNFEVDDIAEAVEELKLQGVVFEHYEGITDEDCIARGISNNRGPDIAWFKDPAGNILSILQTA
jgi:catechol 2,3-dioxygenase-like lactoylglutathione lyase family enzyme